MTPLAHGWLLRCDPASGRFEARLGPDATRDEADGTVTVAAGRPTAPSTAEWKPSTRTLRLVRDRTGRHPLFYARVGSALVASTDIRALLREPDVSRAPSAVVVAEWLLERNGRPEETLIEAVRRVPAGHALTIADDGSETVQREWEPPEPGAWPGAASARFGATLEEAVGSVLDGPVAVFLSGGIDSAAVAAAAAAVSAARGLPPPLALCADIEGSSESATQRAVADALGLELVVRSFAPAPGRLQEALDLAAASLWPVDSAWAAVFEQLLTDARGAGRTVLLDGIGGDELLDAGLGCARTFLRHGQLRALRDLAVAERGFSGASLPVVLRAALGRWRPAPTDPLPPWIADPALRRTLEERGANRPDHDDLLDPFLAASRETVVDRATAGGYAFEQPYADAGLVTLMVGLPAHELVRGGDAKSPARAYLRDRVPAEQGRWPAPAVVGDMLDDLVHNDAPAAWRSLGGARELDALGIRAPEPDHAPLDSDLVWAMLLFEQHLRSWGSCP